MKRLFIAINLPENIKDELEENMKEISALFPMESGGVASWVKKDNLHITLLFIGDTRDEDIPAIFELANEVAQKNNPFDIQLERICYGPPASLRQPAVDTAFLAGEALRAGPNKKIPPRFIWLELAENKQLTAMANELKERAGEKGFLRKSDDRVFSPHITLARIKEWQWRKIEPEEQPDIERDIPLNFEVNSVEVMESALKRTGAEYKVLKTEILNTNI